MKQQFKVGQIIIEKKRIEGRDYLQFEANPHAKSASVVIAAMFAISKYLKWWDNEAINEQTIQFLPSSSGRVVYMDGWESMHLTPDRRVLWAQIGRYHLQTLMSQATRDDLPQIFKQENMKLLELVTVEKLYLDSALSEEREERVKSAFKEFINTHCPFPGTYELDFDQFSQDIKLPGHAVWNCVSESFPEMAIDGMFIYSAYCDGKIMQITVV